MHRMAILAVAVLIVVLGAIALQLGLPPLAERAAARRLTESGGHARVHLKAFPATDLLRKRGDSLVVPDGSTRLEAGDVLTLIGGERAVYAARGKLDGTE